MWSDIPFGLSRATMHCTNKPYLRQNSFVEILDQFCSTLRRSYIGVAKSPSQSKAQLHIGFGCNMSGADRCIPTYSNAHFPDSNGDSVKVSFVGPSSRNRRTMPQGSTGNRTFWSDTDIVVDKDGIPPHLMKSLPSSEGEVGAEAKKGAHLEKNTTLFALKLIHGK